MSVSLAKQTHTSELAPDSLPPSTPWQPLVLPPPIGLYSVYSCENCTACDRLGLAPLETLFLVSVGTCM